MRLSNFLAGMLGCAAIMACSNDLDSQIDNPGEEPNTGNAYMAINLGMGGAGTKAASDGGTDAGTADEGAVKISDAFFYFYDANGNYLTTGKIQATAADQDGSNSDYLKLTSQTGNVENKSNAVVVLGPTETRPSQVLAVLNAGSTSLLDNMPLSQAITQVKSGITATKGAFVMSNSVYMGSNGPVYAQAITDANIKETSTEALAEGTPVNIHVERAAAKVKLTNSNTDGYELTGTTPVVDNKQVSMKIVIDGWCLNAYNENTYLVKNLDASWSTSAPFTNWNAASSYRSYWAKDMNYDGTSDFSSKTGTYKDLVYSSWNDADRNSATSIYCYENTVDNRTDGILQIEGGDYANATTVLIAAHIETKEGEGQYEAKDLFKKNGVYYTKKTLMQNIVASGNYYWYDADNEQEKWIALSTADLEDDDYTIAESTTATTTPATVTITISDIKDKDGYVLVQGNTSTTTVEKSEVIATLNASEVAKDVEGYQGGACYYQVPIEQLYSAANAEIYGVVRNHSYELTLKSVSEVGYPVWNKDNDRPLIPGERKDYYVAATLNVLAWQTVEQEVNL